MSQAIQGQYFTGLLAPWFGGKDPFFSFWFVVIPATLLAYGIGLVRRCGRSAAAWLEYVQTDGAFLFAAIVIAYTTVIASCLDLGENGRFKFAVEPVLWPFVFCVWYRIGRRAP